MLKKNIPVLIFSLFCTLTGFAQDKHFTQFYASPLTLNPALTGAFDGKYRVGIIHRDQWQEVLEKPYVSFAAAADLRLNMRYSSKFKDKIGLGLLFYRDKVGGIDFGTTHMAFSGSYQKALSQDKSQFLSLGIQAGLTQRNLNYELLTFQDQFNGIDGYTIPTAEGFPENNFSFGDFSTGLNYSFNRGGFGLYIGGAIHHILQPNVSFYEDPNIPKNRLFRKYSVQLGSQIPVNERFMILPRLLVASQGPHFEANTGSNFRAIVNRNGDIALQLGAWVRPVLYEDDSFNLDALVLMAGFEYNGLLLGFSYDANIQDLSSVRARNAYEVSIIYIGEYENETILCPSW